MSTDHHQETGNGPHDLLTGMLPMPVDRHGRMRWGVTNSTLGLASTRSAGQSGSSLLMVYYSNARPHTGV